MLKIPCSKGNVLEKNTKNIKKNPKIEPRKHDIQSRPNMAN
jgi:hypothetical protein